MPPSDAAPPNACLNQQLPIAVVVVHRNLATLLPSFAPPPLPPIAIVPPVGRSHHCLPLQLCCLPPPPVTAHMPPPLHAVACMPPPLHAVACTLHLLLATACTLAACHPSQSCPRPLLLAAAHTHTAHCHTHAAAAAYCCTHAASTTAPVTTVTSAAAGAT